MRKSLCAFATLLGLIALDLSAYAQPYMLQPGSGVYGVGCYWYRGRHYCNRYCYREVDGYWFCQPRLRDAGSQAPPLMEFYPLAVPAPRLRRYRHRYAQ
jgi:hypothetical protein